MVGIAPLVKEEWELIKRLAGVTDPDRSRCTLSLRLEAPASR